jgi:hypothetical protein
MIREKTLYAVRVKGAGKSGGKRWGDHMKRDRNRRQMRRFGSWKAALLLAVAAVTFAACQNFPGGVPGHAADRQSNHDPAALQTDSHKKDQSDLSFTISSGPWVRLEGNYLVDLTAFGVIHEDLHNIIDGRVAEQASRENIPKSFAYSGGKFRELAKTIHTAAVEGKELVFQMFDHNGKTFIQRKPYTSTPEVIAARRADRYVIPFSNEHLYAVEPDRLQGPFTVEKITSDVFGGFGFDDFLQISRHVYWASSPSLNPGGSLLVYFSNKSVEEDEPALENGLWLYSFEDRTEQRVLRDRDLECECVLAPQTWWTSDEEFVFAMVGKGWTKYAKYHTASGMARVIYETAELADMKNGWILSRKDQQYALFDVLQEKETVFSAPGRGQEGNVPVSPGGRAAMSFGHEIVVFDHQTGETAAYTVPADGRFTPIGWLAEDVLVLSAAEKQKMTTWLLRL